ncbi:MAG: hypothetical protein WC100_06875 [Sterolibacterium sp.]
MVEVMRADGWATYRIAKVMKLADDTLRKHYPDEIEIGADAIRARILFKMADLAEGGNVSAARAFDSMTRGALAPAPRVHEHDHDEDDHPHRGLGKKEIADLEAKTTPEGSKWAHVLRN